MAPVVSVCGACGVCLWSYSVLRCEARVKHVVRDAKSRRLVWVGAEGPGIVTAASHLQWDPYYVEGISLLKILTYDV